MKKVILVFIILIIFIFISCIQAPDTTTEDPPSAPSNYEIYNVIGEEVIFTFESVSDAEGYKLLLTDESEQIFKFSVEGNDNTLINVGILSPQLYLFELCSYNSYGDSNYPRSGSFYVYDPNDYTPSTPYIYSSTVGGSSRIYVEWRTYNYYDPDNFINRIEVSTETDFTNIVHFYETTETEAEFMFENVEAGSYYIRALASNKYGWSEPSNSKFCSVLGEIYGDYLIDDLDASNEEGYSNSRDIVFTGDMQNVYRVQIWTDPSKETLLTSFYYNNSKTIQLPEEEGVHNLYVDVSDRIGIISSFSKNFTFTLDTVAPQYRSSCFVSNGTAYMNPYNGDDCFKAKYDVQVENESGGFVFIFTNSSGWVDPSISHNFSLSGDYTYKYNESYIDEAGNLSEYGNL